MVLSELITAVRAKNPDLPPEAVDAAVRRLFAEIAAALAESGRVELRGFGVFSVRTHEVRAVRNPKTAEVIDERAMRRIHFKPSKLVADKLRK